jgi:AbrB family looped-hinge helix DNA binding protein
LTTKLSSKGQIVLPKELREAHGWREGDEFVLEDERDGVKLKPVRRFPKRSVADLVGCVGYEGPPRSLEEMDAGIRRAVGGDR